VIFAGNTYSAVLQSYSNLNTQEYLPQNLHVITAFCAIGFRCASTATRWNWNSI